MPLFERRPVLPDDLLPAWRSFLDAAEVIEAGRRTLLSTMPVGRVEPAPVAIGVQALRQSLDDADGWMGAWSGIPQLTEDHQDCLESMAESRANLDQVNEVAASTNELEELQAAVEDVIVPLDAFADAERTWRRTWRIPR